jgi:hypothetical protein
MSSRFEFNPRLVEDGVDHPARAQHSGCVVFSNRPVHLDLERDIAFTEFYLEPVGEVAGQFRGK